MKADVLKSGFQTITQVTNSPVMFAVKGNVLYLGGHSEVITVVMTADVDHEDFHYVLPAEHVRQIAKTLKSGEVDIHPGDTDESLVVKSGRATAVYTTLTKDSISYKLLTMHHKDDFVYRVPGPEMARGFQSILPFSVSDVDDQRVKNLHIALEGDVMELAASNNFTIAKYSFPVEKNYGKGDMTLRLVNKSLAFLGKTFGEFVDIGFSDKKLYYTSSDGTFTYKVTVPTVDFPPFKYRELFAKLEGDPNVVEILLDKEEFIEQGKNFLYFTDEDIRNKVRLEYSPTAFRIEGNNGRGTFETELVPLKVGASGEMYASLDYLTKAANTLSSTDIVFKVVDNKIMISDTNFSVVIPPLRK